MMRSQSRNLMVNSFYTRAVMIELFVQRLERECTELIMRHYAPNGGRWCGPMKDSR